MPASDEFDSIVDRLPRQLANADELEDWCYDMRADAQPAVLEVYAAVATRLAEASAHLHAEESGRREAWTLFPGESNPESLTKSAESLRDKLSRTLGTQAERLTTEGLRAHVMGFPDVGRFRVVCQFERDAVRAVNALIGPERLGPLGDWPLHGPLKDYVTDLARRDPAKGHRARQFAVRHESGFLVEVQVMTLLQHAWDRRNHAVYEFTRRGRQLPHHVILRDVALAETLYLVDLQADAQWGDFLERRSRELTEREP